MSNLNNLLPLDHLATMINTKEIGKEKRIKLLQEQIEIYTEIVKIMELKIHLIDKET